MYVRVASLLMVAAATAPPMPVLNNLHGLLPFLITNTLKGGDNVNTAVQWWDNGNGDQAAVNERGQFLSDEAFAKALSEQLGLPPTISKELATLTRTYLEQVLAFNKALSDLFLSMENDMPDAKRFVRPLLAGLDVAGQASKKHAIRAAVPVITNALDVILSGGSDIAKIPKDFLLEIPQMKLKDINDVIQHLAPIEVEYEEEEESQALKSPLTAVDTPAVAN